MTSPFDSKKSAPATPRAQGGMKHHPPPQAKPRTLRIESIAAGGSGVARDSGRAVFVPRTAPSNRNIEHRANSIMLKIPLSKFQRMFMRGNIGSNYVLPGEYCPKIYGKISIL